MKTVYLAKSRWLCDIIAYELKKETDKSVWVREEKWTLREGPKQYETRRRAKESRGERFFNNFDEAKEWLINEIERQVESHKKTLSLKLNDLEKVKNFFKPTVEE